MARLKIMPDSLITVKADKFPRNKDWLILLRLTTAWANDVIGSNFTVWADVGHHRWTANITVHTRQAKKLICKFIIPCGIYVIHGRPVKHRPGKAG